MLKKPTFRALSLNESLQCIFSVCSQSSVVRKQQLSDKCFPYLVLCSEAGEFTQASIASGMEVDAILCLLSIIYSIFLYVYLSV